MYQITKEQYFKNLVKRFPNDDFTILNFTNAKSPVSIKCNTCGQIYHYCRGTTLYSQRRTNFCRLCNSKSVIAMRKACEENNISIIKMTYNVTEPWSLHCNKCNADFQIAPSKWIKYDCPNCGNNHNCYTKKIRQQLVDEKFGIGEFEVLSEGAATRRFTVRHKCGFIRNTQFFAFMKSQGCPRCCGTMSKGERKIAEYLDKNKFFYETQKKMGNTQQSFDFYLPDLKIVIEYNGEQHYFPIETFGGEKRFIQQQEYDKNKQIYCYNNNLILKIISYKDFNNIDTILDTFFKKFNDQSQDVKEN